MMLFENTGQGEDIPDVVIDNQDFLAGQNGI